MKWPSEGDAPELEIKGVHHQSLIDIIKEVIEDGVAMTFYMTPFSHMWKVLEEWSIKVYSEAYASPAMMEAYIEVNSLPCQPDDNLEHMVTSLMMYSDLTHLSHFGDPTASACHHVVYIPTLPDDFQDSYFGFFEDASSSEVYMHCKHELMQAIWRLLLDEDFMHAYEHGIVNCCGDGITCRVFLHFFNYLADYPEKILLAGIKFLGECLCPHCLIKKADVSEMGTEGDMHDRLALQHVNDQAQHKKINHAWMLIFQCSAPVDVIKLHSQPKKLPKRDKKGHFIKKNASEADLSDSTFPSSDSSPLDTPETNHRALELLQEQAEESEYEVAQQLANDEEDDKESLAGAPDPSTILFSEQQPQSPAHTSIVALEQLPFPHEQQPSPPRERRPFPSFIQAKPRATKATIPAAPALAQLRPTPINVMASGPLPALFHGKESENVQNFMRSTEAYFLINRITDEAMKVALFSTLISVGSQADHWWMNLDAQHKGTWTTVKAAFKTKWPTIALKTLVQDAGVTNAPVLIHPIRDTLPRVLRDLMTPAPPDWNTFLNEIKDVNVDILQDKVKQEKEKKEAERAQNVRIACLESRQHDPVEVLRLQMQQATLGASAPTRGMSTTMPQMRGNPMMQQGQVTRRQVCYTPANQSQNGQRVLRSAPTQEGRDNLQARVNEIPHQTDTDAGHAAYNE
ncbi:hypothetical protein EDD22DRAFT_954542 [Suillus occidentalis]|nr:hypothetical protein EDD22DRAFT_954542 [Suillus occidentalis]